MDSKWYGNDIAQIVDMDRAHIWHHLIQHKPFETGAPRIIVEGKGMRVWDQKGTEFLDAVSGGVWTVNVGYGRESIANAVRDQLIKLNYFAGTAGSVPGAIFSEQLLEKMEGLSRVYYCNSGSEANEKAFKMVRQIAINAMGAKNTKSFTASAIITAPPLRAYPPAGMMSATSNMVRSPRALCACRIVRIPRAMGWRRLRGKGSRRH